MPAPFAMQITTGGLGSCMLRLPFASTSTRKNVIVAKLGSFCPRLRPTVLQRILSVED
jgi:hypothetical protein